LVFIFRLTDNVLQLLQPISSHGFYSALGKKVYPENPESAFAKTHLISCRLLAERDLTVAVEFIPRDGIPRPRVAERRLKWRSTGNSPVTTRRWPFWDVFHALKAMATITGSLRD
jgi:hypothetical protein